MYEDTDNLRVLVCNAYTAIQDMGARLEEPNNIIMDHEKLIEYAKEQNRCTCFYCKTKENIEITEICNVTKEKDEKNDSIPKILAYSFKERK